MVCHMSGFASYKTTKLKSDNPRMGTFVQAYWFYKSGFKLSRKLSELNFFVYSLRTLYIHIQYRELHGNTTSQPTAMVMSGRCLHYFETFTKNQDVIQSKKTSKKCLKYNHQSKPHRLLYMYVWMV